MPEAPPSIEIPAPARPAAHIGQPRDLVWLFLFGGAALFLTQGVALAFLAAWFRPDHPDLSPPQLWRWAARQAGFNAFFAVSVQTVLYVLVTLFIYLRVTRRTRSPFWPAVAWRPMGSRRAALVVLGGTALAIVIQLGTAAFPPPELLPIEKFFTTRATALLVLGASLLVAPFFEELIFRGYLYGVLEPAWGVAPAVVVSGILFGLLHVPQLIPGWIQIGFLFLVGILFSLVRARTGSLRASFLMHFAYNATLAALFLSSRDFAELPASARTLSAALLSALTSGGGFGT
ncbi:MAG: lysostaphin resistance A-like protein [Terriglobia bacterium]